MRGECPHHIRPQADCSLCRTEFPTPNWLNKGQRPPRPQRPSREQPTEEQMRRARRLAEVADLDRREIAAEVGVNERTLYRMLKRGHA